tara:strand:+ start:294 stop:497 length:204 start_codon:yes stop_codon:yes gene_type:complete
VQVVEDGHKEMELQVVLVVEREPKVLAELEALQLKETLEAALDMETMEEITIVPIHIQQVEVAAQAQ